MCLIRDSLMGKSVFVGKKVEVEGACNRAHVSRLFDHDYKPLSSGAVSHEELVAKFRSETAKIFIFIQVSKESLNWDSRSGMTIMELAVDGLLAELFRKWKVENVNHLVTIVLFYRTVDDEESPRIIT